MEVITGDITFYITKVDGNQIDAKEILAEV